MLRYGPRHRTDVVCVTTDPQRIGRREQRHVGARVEQPTDLAREIEPRQRDGSDNERPPLPESARHMMTGGSVSRN